MRRRDFITLLGGAVFGLDGGTIQCVRTIALIAALGSPVLARAQVQIPVVGLLSPLAPGSSGPFLDAFRRGLAEFNRVEGQNVVIDYRLAGGFDRLAELAADLVRRRVSVIAASGTEVAVAAKAATKTIPIAFMAAEDPVKIGLVASLAHPGGNATGLNFFTAEVNAKRLGLLHELLPNAARIAVLVNPSNARNTSSTLVELEPAARALGLQTEVFNASTGQDIDVAFAAIASRRFDGLFVAPDGFFTGRRVQLATLAARYAIPATYSVRDIVDVGGLMSYGASLTDAYRQLGYFIGRMLGGEKPSEMPVVQSTKFEFVLNAQIARMLGITVPPTLLAHADEVIE